MGPEVVNRNKDSVFHGDYAGRDLNVTNVIMFQDSEREFVVTHNANIKPVSYFTGRETELQDLRQRIEEGCKSVLVSGMGGIGKTHICRKLFDEYSTRNGRDENGSFKHIGYIQYDGDMNSSLMNCLKYKKQEQQKDNQEAAWRELEYLASGGKLLLFVDNVNVSVGEDPNLKRLMSIPGAIILTSRRRVFSKEFEPYRIGFLSTKQCREIYEKNRFENSGKRVAEEEVPDLEYVIDTLTARHTITIEFLAHLARTNNWTVKKLREELEKNGFQLEYMDEEDKLVNIQKSYETLYDMSVLTEAEQNILEAFSVFPYIPLKTEICNQWLLADAGVSEEDYVLMKLYRKGWLQFDAEQEGYALHPVFAQFIYEECRPTMEKHAGLVGACRKSLEIPKNGVALECRKFVPFAENIIEKVDMVKGMEQADFIYVLAKLLQYVAEYKKAEKWYEDCIEICKNVWGENHPNTSKCYINLGQVCEHLGKYGKAVVMSEKSKRISNNVIAASLNIERQEEIGDWENLLKKNMQFMKNIVGEEHPNTADNYFEFARIFEKKGEYGKAEELYEKGLSIYKNALEENHLSTVKSYANLAKCYEKQGKYNEAEELYEKGLSIYKNALGENHLSTVKSYANLAECYKKQGKYNEAEELYEKSLVIYKILLGENHPDTASCYANLAECLKKQGKFERALGLYEKSLAILESVFDYGHPNMGPLYVNLIDLYFRAGEDDKVAEIYKKSSQLEAIYKKMLQDVEDKDIPAMEEYFGGLKAIQGIRELLNSLLKKVDEIHELKEKWKKLLQSLEKGLGENHPDVARWYSEVASSYEGFGWFGNSLEFYLKAYKIFVFRFGLYYMDTQAAYVNMKNVYSQWNPEGDFEQWLEEKMKE